jgi:hypothetical protein
MCPDLLPPALNRAGRTTSRLLAQDAAKLHAGRFPIKLAPLGRLYIKGRVAAIAAYPARARDHQLQGVCP